MDINVTEAALWSEDEYNQIISYLENSGLDVFAEQAKSFREKGMDGYEEWQRIEEAAAKLPPDELVRLGKGPHLLSDQKGQTKPTAASPASTAPKPPESSA